MSKECMFTVCMFTVNIQQGTSALTDTEHEVIEGLVVDVHQRHLHGQSEIGQICQVLPTFPVWNLFFLLARSDKSNIENSTK